jgi:hypothetical protein
VFNRFNFIFKSSRRTKLNKIINKTQRRVNKHFFSHYFSAKISSQGMRQPTIHQIREESFLEEEPRKSKRFNTGPFEKRLNRGILLYGYFLHLSFLILILLFLPLFRFRFIVYKVIFLFFYVVSLVFSVCTYLNFHNNIKLKNRKL